MINMIFCGNCGKKNPLKFVQEVIPLRIHIFQHLSTAHTHPFPILLTP